MLKSLEGDKESKSSKEDIGLKEPGSQQRSKELERKFRAKRAPEVVSG